MKFSKTFAVLLLASGLTFAANPAAISSVPTSILPKQFSAWQVSDSAQSSKDPEAADASNAALLKEYGFTGYESATYTRGDGQKLTIKAQRASLTPPAPTAHLRSTSCLRC